MLCGTGHVVYTMLPIIYDVAIKNGIRPERPMAASSIASQMGIIASPVSVAVVSLVAFLAKAPAGAPIIDFIHPAVHHHPVHAGRCADDRHLQLVPRQGPGQGRPGLPGPDRHPEPRKRSTATSATLLGRKLSTRQWTAMWIFIGAIAVVALLGAFTRAAPAGGRQAAVDGADDPDVHADGRCADHHLHQDQPAEIGKNEVFRAGMIAVVAVFGVAWMADTVFEANLPIIKASLTDAGEGTPLDLCHRAAAGVQAGQLAGRGHQRHGAAGPVDRRAPGYVVAFAAACYGYYILPTYPSDLATIQFDRSGTTHIGKYVINHSFIGCLP
jgi:anaerobic C4-dicarboxylate transporter DcuB